MANCCHVDLSLISGSYVHISNKNRQLGVAPSSTPCQNERTAGLSSRCFPKNHLSSSPESNLQIQKLGNAYHTTPSSILRAFNSATELSLVWSIRGDRRSSHSMPVAAVSTPVRCQPGRPRRCEPLSQACTHGRRA